MCLIALNPPGVIKLNGETITISDLTYANSYNGFITFNQGNSVCNTSSSSSSISSSSSSFLPSHKGCAVIITGVNSYNFSTSNAGFNIYFSQNSLIENNQIGFLNFNFYSPVQQPWSNITVRNSNFASGLQLSGNGIKVDNITNTYNTFLQGTNNQIQNSVFTYGSQQGKKKEPHVLYNFSIRLILTCDLDGMYVGGLYLDEGLVTVRNVQMFGKAVFSVQGPNSIATVDNLSITGYSIYALRN